MVTEFPLFVKITPEVGAEMLLVSKIHVFGSAVGAVTEVASDAVDVIRRVPLAAE